MSDEFYLVYAVKKVNRQHHFRPIRPQDVDIAEARIFTSQDDARDGMKEMGRRHMVVACATLSDPVFAAQLVHVGMVAF